MLVIKDLYSDISDCFWLFYGSKYKTGLYLFGPFRVNYKYERYACDY